MRMCGVGLNSKVKDKTMITFDEKKYPQITDAEIKEALRFSTEQVIRDLPEFTDQFQNAYSENGFYQPIPNNYWTCGFWTGEIWLAYEYSQDERLKKAGEVQVKSFLDRIDNRSGSSRYGISVFPFLRGSL